MATGDLRTRGISQEKVNHLWFHLLIVKIVSLTMGIMYNVHDDLINSTQLVYGPMPLLGFTSHVSNAIIDYKLSSNIICNNLQRE